MELIYTVNAYLEHNFDGLDFLVRDKNAFHARDASTVLKSQFSIEELELRKKLNLCTKKVEGKCMRCLFYDFQKKVVTNPIEPDSLRTMEMGNACERNEQDYYKCLGIFHSAHVRMFNKEFNISGEIDNFVWEYDDVLAPDGRFTGRVIIRDPRRLIGVEIKSFYGYYAEKEIITGGNPKMNHVLQSLIYLDHYKPNVPYWLLVYLSRTSGVDTPNGRVFGRQFKIQINDGDIFIDGMPITEFTMRDIYNRFVEAQFYIQNELLPERDYVYNFPAELVELKYAKQEISKKEYGDWKKGIKYISNWQCNYCSYLYECWKDVFGEKVRGADKQPQVKKEESQNG